jgi:hypothetical protein
MLRSLAQGISTRRRTFIDSIAQAMPDAASRDRFLGDVMTASRPHDPAVDFNLALTQISSPAARLETLRQLVINSHLTGNNSHMRAANIPAAQLQQWGLTRQQVEQAQAPGR